MTRSSHTDGALKACLPAADAVGMTAHPEPMRAEPLVGAERACPDCGGPVEAESATDHPFFICRSCYDAYVDNAGR